MGLNSALRQQSNQICLALICYLLAGRAFAFLYRVAAGAVALGAAGSQALLLVCYMLPLAVPFLLLAKGSGVKQYLCKPPRAVLPHGFVLFFAGYFVALLTNTAVSALLGLAGLGVRASAPAVPASPAALILYILHYVVCAAVVEECLFRGILLARLRMFGDRFAVVVSALLFAAVHFDLSQAAGIFVIALLFGYVAVKSGSIVPSIVLHAVNNALALALLYAQTTLSATVYQALVTAIIAVCGVLALIVLIAGIVRRKPISLGRSVHPVRFFCGLPGVVLVASLIVLTIERIEVLL